MINNRADGSFLVEESFADGIGPVSAEARFFPLPASGAALCPLPFPRRARVLGEGAGLEATPGIRIDTSTPEDKVDDFQLELFRLELVDYIRQLTELHFHFIKILDHGDFLWVKAATNMLQHRGWFLF